MVDKGVYTSRAVFWLPIIVKETRSVVMISSVHEASNLKKYALLTKRGNRELIQEAKWLLSILELWSLPLHF